MDEIEIGHNRFKEVTQIEPIADILEKSAEGFRGFRGLVEKILGKSPEDVRETLRAMEGLTPAQIREALRAYRESS